MNRELKQKWIDALRSGEYPQTTGKLQRTYPRIIRGETIEPAGYCCLGVLCSVAGVKFIPNVDTFLPKDFENSINVSNEILNMLIKLNDGGVVFRVIADYIKKNIPIDDEAAQD